MTQPPLMVPVLRRGGMVGAIRRNPALYFGGAVLILMALIAVFAPWLGTTDPTAISPLERLQNPSAHHWFGTDMMGRDIYSRVLYGSRVSLTVGMGVALFATVFGLLIGLVAGYVRWADALIMRVSDGLMAIPSILLAISLMAIASASMTNVIVAVSITELPRMARLVRGVVLSARESAYVAAAITNGTRLPGIIINHILPNAVAPVIVQASYVCASAMLVEASLSFIGVGTPPSVPSWGNIMSDARSLWELKPFIVFVPAAFLSVTVLAVNLLGDGLRERLDPTLQGD